MEPNQTRPDTTTNAAWKGRSSYASSAPTRSKIISAATKLFAYNGFNGASLRGIAKAAGVDHSTLIHHFRDKKTLLSEALRSRDIAYAPEEAIEVLTTRILVESLVRVAELGQEDPEASQLFSNMSAEAAAEDHPARPYLKERHAALLTILGEAIRAQRDAGNLEENGLTPEQEAARLISAWEGHEVFARLHPDLADVPTLWEITLRSGLGLAGDDEGTVINLDATDFQNILEP